MRVQFRHRASWLYHWRAGRKHERRRRADRIAARGYETWGEWFLRRLLGV